MRCGFVVGAALLGTLSTLVQGCLACNEPGCSGGFSWNATPAAGGAVAAGTYSFEVVVEEDRYQIECQIADTYGNSDCKPAVHTEGSVDYNIHFDFGQLDAENWDPDDGVSGFELRISDTTGSNSSDSYNETRGPTEVAIHASLDGSALFDVEYALEYERDENFYGDERCGFCDSSERREHQL